jgi:hypothetical protein
MDGIHKFSNQVIDLAERLSDVADAANGKGRRSSRGGTRWVLLPAAGAALYALVRSDFFARQAKGVADEAKSRAADLPNDLMNAVRQTAEKPASSSNGTAAKSRRSSSARRSSSRSTSSSRSGSRSSGATKTRSRKSSR